MAFEPARSFLFKAANTFHMGPQAQSGIVCAQAKELLNEEFKDFAECWTPIKLQLHTLTIKASSSAARSALYMHQMKVLEAVQKLEVPVIIKELKIV